MKIVADENIPYVRAAFSTLGEVVTYPGRQLQHAELRGADLLLVRSVTPVDAGLLTGTSIHFVGTATIGIDHIDQAFLAERNIAFASAPGCNAISTAEYAISALLILAERRGVDLTDLTVGIVGYGNVGTCLTTRLESLGIHCLINDPPRAERFSDRDYVALNELVDHADVVSAHVPLTQDGRYPTYHLFDQALLPHLKPNAWFINASRGPVVAEQDLLKTLVARPDLAVVLDVWETEPRFNVALLDQIELGTPHIAGYSLDGKVRGTEMIYQAACAHLGLTPTWIAQQVMPPAPLVSLEFSESALDHEALRQAVLSCYDARTDDAALRLGRKLDSPVRGAHFDHLRKSYRTRREFSALTIKLPGSRTMLREQLQGLGFSVVPTKETVLTGARY